ncbi:hypothetical protein MAUB1S_03683 [Mycolicibacterium aubagnense]
MPPETASAPAQDVIHNIGYRNYSGARLGRAYARRSLFSQSLRGAYGLGRSAKSKVLPMILFGVMCLPAAIMVAVAVSAKLSKLPVEYARYAIIMQVVIGLFLARTAIRLARPALQDRAPVLLTPIERIDYVTAKFAAMVSALFILTATPLLILYVGALLAKLDFADQTEGFAQGLVSVALLSLLFAGVGLVVAALTPRRGFGVAAVIAVLTISYGVVSTVQGIALQRDSVAAIGWMGLFSPITLIDGVQTAFLSADSTFPTGTVPAPPRASSTCSCSSQ